MANEPFYDSRLLADGTNQAELVYNELIGRQKTAHATIKSRVITAPPGSPAIFDGYLVPTGATGDWTGLDGSLVFWINSWVAMTPKVGMSFIIEDEDMLIIVDANNALIALDGCQTIIPDGSGNIVWDVTLGATAYVTITLPNNELKAPLNMKAGRIYIILFKQAGFGNEVHFEPGAWNDASGGDLDAGQTIGQLDIFGFVGPSCASLVPEQIFHNGVPSGTGVTPHAPSHGAAGSDPITVENLRTSSTDVTEVLQPAGGNTLAMGPLPVHAPNHELGGSDELAIEDQRSGASVPDFRYLQSGTSNSATWQEAVPSQLEGSMTGILTGWAPNGFTASTITLTAGTGRIVDNATVAGVPVITPVAGGPYAGVTVTAVATHFETFFYVDSGGALQQQTTPPTLEEERSRIYVAVALHSNGVVTELYSAGTSIYEGWRVFHDLLRSASILNIVGNDYFRDVANPLGIQVSTGTIWSPEINRDGTAANRRKPNNKDQLAATAISFEHFQDDGAGNFQLVSAAETDIDVLQRDDGAGGLVTMANNRNTINIVYRQPNGATAVQYTQIEYNPSTSSAQEQIQTVPFLLKKPWLARYAIDIPRGVSDLDDAVFLELTVGGLSGGGGGGGAASVQRSVALSIVSPHVIEANTGTQFSPRAAGQIEELHIIPGVLTEVAGGTFTVQVYAGPDLGSLVSVGTVSLVGAADSGTLSLGSPHAFSANDIFVCNTDDLGTFPTGTLARRKKLYLHVRYT